MLYDQILDLKSVIFRLSSRIFLGFFGVDVDSFWQDRLCFTSVKAEISERACTIVHAFCFCKKLKFFLNFIIKQ
jgi:hypothetical protein